MNELDLTETCRRGSPSLGGGQRHFQSDRCQYFVFGESDDPAGSDAAIQLSDYKSLWREMGDTNGIEVLVTAGRLQRAGTADYLCQAGDEMISGASEDRLPWAYGLSLLYPAGPKQIAYIVRMAGTCYAIAAVDDLKRAAFQRRGLARLLSRDEPPSGVRLLEDFEQLQRRGHVESALDLLYSKVDGLLRAGRFNDVNSLLKVVDVKRASSDLLLGLLTTTLPARSRLDYRRAFFGKVEGELRSRADWDETLLLGLED